MATNNNKRPITDPVLARVAMIDGMFSLPDENLQAMKEIRAAVAECAKKIEVATRKRAKKHDTGTVINVMRKLQSIKNLACDSVILPYAEEDIPADV
jgi:c-di-GMP-related signal transduction protein